MKCSNCNKEIEDSSAFCPFCGAKVENVAEVKEEKKDTNVEEKTQDVAEEPVVEEKKEVVVEEKHEEVKAEEPKVESTEKVTSTVNTTSNTTNSQKKQRHSIITLAIGIAIILVILIIALVAVGAKSPEKLYKSFIKSQVTEMLAGDAVTSNSANVSTTVEISTDISSLKDVADGLRVDSNVQYNIEDKQAVVSLNVDKKTDSYLALKSMADLSQNKVYVSESNLFDKVIMADISEEYQDMIKEYTGEEGITVPSKSTAKKAAKEVYSAIDDNLSKDLFTRQSVTVNISGKDKKVKDNQMTITSEQLKDVIQNVTKTLKMDNDFLSCYTDRDEVVEALDQLETAVDDLDDEDMTINIHYYTSGLTNKFVGVAVVASSSSNYEAILEVINTSKNVYEINLKETQYSSTSTVATATLTVNKLSKNEKDVTLSTELEDYGNLSVRVAYSASYNKAIEAMDTSSAVDYNDLTDEDMETIYTNFEDSKLYEAFSSYIDDALDSLGISSSPTTKRDVPAGITLGKDQSFVESYDDDVVVFTVPTTFEEEYSGLSYQRFSKDDKTKETAYIDVDCNWDTLEEYENSIDTTASYYTEASGYKDVKVSDREEVKVGDNTFYKKTLEYTYESGSYSYTQKTTYYYIEINDEYVYSVEVDDQDGIVKDTEIEKMLTIDVTLAN